MQVDDALKGAATAVDVDGYGNADELTLEAAIGVETDNCVKGFILGFIGCRKIEKKPYRKKRS